MSNTCKQESGSTQLGVPTWGDFTANLATALGLSPLPVAHPRPRRSTKTSRRRPYSSATAPSSLLPNNFKLKSGSTQLGMPTRGRFHNKPRHGPLDSLSYPPPTQDLVAPPKRVVVGRTAALWLRLCHCLTPVSKKLVEPSSGCQHGGDFKKKLATSLGLSFLPVAHPRPRCSTKTSRRRWPYGSATAPS